MKTINYFSFVLLIMMMGAPIIAQPSHTLKEQCYTAYLNNSVAVWKTIENQAKNRYNENQDNMYLLIELTRVQYGLLNACIATDDEVTYDEYIDEAHSNVDELLEANENWSEAHALKAGLYSIEMGFSPGKGMFLGSKSEEHIQKAIKIDPLEPTGWIRKGGSKLFTPKMFGGSIEAAVKYYKKAISIYENDTLKSKNNWEYINTLAWLGIAYKKQENYNGAMKIFKKALSVEPNFNWVSKQLIPALENDMRE